MTELRLGWVCLVVSAFMACTERNPEYCGDGTCIDPSKPYCDVDGSFSGTPGTCIAVSCTAGEFQKCRDDIAIICNANGTNYDQRQCEMGCEPDASGCKQCTTNAQCSSSEVCASVSSHCRGCAADDECDSRVCDLQTSTCVAESAVLYASPNGSGTCSVSAPCSLMKAVVTALNATPMPVVRMLPGNYTSPLRAEVPTATPLKIVATGANMVVVGNTAALLVGQGAKIEIRNLSSTSERQVQCGVGDVNGPFSAVLLRDANLSMVGAGLGFEIERCEIAIHNVELATASVDILGTRDDSTFKADGFYVRGTGITSIIAAGSRVTIDVVNAVFENVQVLGFLADTGPPGSSVKFAHSTFLFPTTSNVCNGAGSANVSLVFENSILAVKGPGNVFATPTACTFVTTLLSRQPTAPSGTLVADPRFVDLAGGDFHLSSDSPAIDVASPGDHAPDHDLEGTPRPQGAKSDLGAYEFRP